MATKLSHNRLRFTQRKVNAKELMTIGSIKKKAAELYDEILDMEIKGQEHLRCLERSMDHIEESVMWAVKAITY